MAALLAAFAAAASAGTASAQTNAFVTSVGAVPGTVYTAGFGPVVDRLNPQFLPTAGLQAADVEQPPAAGVVLTTPDAGGYGAYLNSGVTNVGGLTSGVCSNGQWDPGRPRGDGGPFGGAYVTVSQGATARFTFASLLAGFGATINYAPGCQGRRGAGTGAVLRLFSDGGTLLATYDVAALAPVTTVDGGTGLGSLNAGAFRGFTRAVADVRAVEVAGPATFVVLDDLRYSTGAAPTAVVPEPGPLALLGTGLAVVAGAVMRRRAEARG